MRIQSFRAPTPGDNPKLPEEYFRANKSQAEQIDLVTQALQNNLSEEDNFNADRKRVSLFHNQEQTISTGRVKGKAAEVRIVHSALFDFPRLAWEVVDEGKIRVKVAWDSNPTEAVEVVLMIKGSGDALRTQ